MLQGVAVGVVVALLALLVWKLATQSHAEAKAGQAAPAFSLPRLDAPGTISLADYRGHPVVLNFWASWCQPCKQEAPLFATAADRYRGKLVVLGIDAKGRIVQHAAGEVDQQSLDAGIKQALAS